MHRYQIGSRQRSRSCRQAKSGKLEAIVREHGRAIGNGFGADVGHFDLSWQIK